MGQDIIRNSVKIDLTGTTVNNASAILQLDSTTKGVLPPRMTNAQMIAISNVAGLSAYQSDLVVGNKLFDGTVIRHINDSEGTYIKTGTNKTAGLATLVAGTVTVSTTKVTANSMIFLTRQTTSGTLGTSVDITARVDGTSFTITSNGSVLDTSTVAWQIIEPY
jgi:hypothetical protein